MNIILKYIYIYIIIINKCIHNSFVNLNYIYSPHLKTYDIHITHTFIYIRDGQLQITIGITFRTLKSSGPENVKNKQKKG